MSNELKPCPFCGSEVQLAINGLVYKRHGWKAYVIVCTNWNCICATGIGDSQFETEEEAAKAWNRRYYESTKEKEEK